jgi:hypothetical protein
VRIAQRKSSSRDVLKPGLLRSAALYVPLERTARIQLAVANRLTDKQIPASSRGDRLHQRVSLICSIHKESNKTGK